MTKELFTIQCTVNHEHSWLCNWFGSHVTFVKDSVKWNEELGRWEAQCKIGSSMMSMINSSTTKKNYFGGITHHYDVTNYTFDLYYDPNFTGLNSQSKEVTGMWLPVQEYVVPVYCYTEPSMPNMAKITNNVIWMRDAANTKNYLRSKLINGTYTVGQMYQKDGAFYVDVTINDLSAYIDAFEAKFGEGYMVGDWTANNTLEDFVFVLKYTGSTTDYKQDGTGWSIEWPNTTEKNNARTLWLTKQYTVTYTDGAEGKVFADQAFTVFAMTETAKDKFTATATPVFEAPARKGYTFAGWTPEVAATVTADATYTAVWTINTYNITVETNAGGNVTVQSTADFNEVVKIAITPNAGYSVVSAKLVYVSDGIPVTTNLMNAERFRMPAADVTVVVEFSANDYTLTLDANGGTVDPASIVVTYDSAIGELPVPTKVKATFLGWYDAEGNEVTAETIYTVAGDSTITAKWLDHPSVSNVTNELFTIQCSVKHEHSWLCNWFGSHLELVKDSVKWNAEQGRWEAQIKTKSSMLSLINSSTTKKNYFGGMTHHYDQSVFVFDVYFDPNFTGLSSSKKEVTGMWLPVQEYVIPVYCYTEPSMPDISKISGTMIWARDAGNKNSTHSQKFTVKQLVEGSYTVGKMYTENGKFYVDVTVTDLSAVIKALGEKTGKSYVLPAWEKHYNSAADFSFTLEYTGSATDYKQDGTGWSIAASTWANNSEKLNGKSLWLTEQFTVTYTDGMEGKEFFADQIFTVNAYTENGKTGNAVTDFSATATPTIEDPSFVNYIFNGWTPAVAETVTETVTYTAQWIQYP